jgi:hypothetical protein
VIGPGGVLVPDGLAAVVTFDRLSLRGEQRADTLYGGWGRSRFQGHALQSEAEEQLCKI